MPPTNRKRIFLLLVLGALWASLLGWQWWHGTAAVHVPLANRSGPARESRSPVHSQGLRVHLDQLAASGAQREIHFATPRNIFAAVPSAGTAVAASAVQETPPELRLPTPDEERQLAAAAELSQFRYLGYFRLGARTIGMPRNVAVLTKQDEIHVVRTGETIDKQVLVKAITADGVTLQHVGSSVVQTVPAAGEPLVGQPSN